MVKVAVVLINYNGMQIKFMNRSILSRCVSDIKKTRFGSFKLVVVDNGSTDRSREFLKKNKVEFIYRKNNIYNFAVVANMGITHVVKNYDPEYIVVMSNDVFLEDRKWLSKMISEMESHPRHVISYKNPHLPFRTKTSHL